MSPHCANFLARGTAKKNCQQHCVMQFVGRPSVVCVKWLQAASVDRVYRSQEQDDQRLQFELPKQLYCRHQHLLKLVTIYEKSLIDSYLKIND